MALNYAEQWSPELLEILMQGTLTSPFVTSNVRWLDVFQKFFIALHRSYYVILFTKKIQPVPTIEVFFTAFNFIANENPLFYC